MANLLAPLSKLRAAMATATRDYAAAVEALERLKRERAAIDQAPAARVDLIAELSARVDCLAADYSEAIDRRLGLFVMSGPERAAKYLGLSNEESVGSFFHLTKHFQTWDNPRHLKEDRAVTDAAFCFFVGPERVKAALIERANALNIRGEGLPLVERRVRLAELDAQIQAAERELESMREALRASGLAVPADAPPAAPLVPRY